MFDVQIYKKKINVQEKTYYDYNDLKLQCPFTFTHELLGNKVY
jgi:hypothetical protein